MPANASQGPVGKPAQERVPHGPIALKKAASWTVTPWKEAALRDWPNAVQAYQKYLGFQGQIFDEDTPSDWVLAKLGMARSLAAQGDVPQAIQRYDEFLRLWANADPDLPALRQARAERAKLQPTIH